MNIKTIIIYISIICFTGFHVFTQDANTLAIVSAEKSNSPDFITQKLTNIQQVGSKHFTNPQWSPDDDKLLVGGTGYNGIFVIHLNPFKIDQLTNLPKSGYRPTWTADGQQVVFRHKDYLQNRYGGFVVQAVFLDGRKAEMDTPVDAYSIPSSAMAQTGDLVLKYDNKTLEVHAHQKNSEESWLVTTLPGQYYYPVLSPDKTKVLVNDRMSMLVFAADGSGLIARLENGLGGSWSPDSKHIVYFLDDTQDGHVISASDLYLTDLDGQVTQLTHTTDMLEMYPDWSNDGKRIAFGDRRTGNIYIANINLKK